MSFDTDNLANLPHGESAEIHSMADDFAHRDRFLELGFTSGAPVQVLRKALFGDPIVIQVRGSRFALRKVDAQNITVKKSKKPSK